MTDVSPRNAPPNASGLVLEDERTVADLRTFVSRARVLVPDGSVRLQTFGRALQLTVLVRSGEGLLGSGTVTAMRGAPLAADGSEDPFAGGQMGGPGIFATTGTVCDVVVDLSAVADRLARMADEGDTTLSLPPVTRTAAWAAVTAPTSGWEVVGDTSPEELAGIASELLGQLAARRDAGASEAELAAADKALWAGSVGEGQRQFRAALVLGAHALGFLSGAHARVLRHGSWQRLSTAAGSVITR